MHNDATTSIHHPTTRQRMKCLGILPQSHVAQEFKHEGTHSIQFYNCVVVVLLLAFAFTVMQDKASFAVNLGLIGLSTLPVYRLNDKALGHSLHWEEQYWRKDKTKVKPTWQFIETQKEIRKKQR